MNPFGNSCLHCAWFKENKKECHRNPPALQTKLQPGMSTSVYSGRVYLTETGWPNVKPDDYCGEFTEKPK